MPYSLFCTIPKDICGVIQMCGLTLRAMCTIINCSSFCHCPSIMRRHIHMIGWGIVVAVVNVERGSCTLLDTLPQLVLSRGWVLTFMQVYQGLQLELERFLPRNTYDLKTFSIQTFFKTPTERVLTRNSENKCKICDFIGCRC